MELHHHRPLSTATAPGTGYHHSVDTSSLYELNSVPATTHIQKYRLELLFDNKSLSFEVYIGMACTLIVEKTSSSTRSHEPPRLETINVFLRIQLEQSLQVVGTQAGQITHKGKTWNLPLLVVKGSSFNLLSRNWFSHFGINIAGISYLSHDEHVSKHLDSYHCVHDKDATGYVGPAA